MNTYEDYINRESSEKSLLAWVEPSQRILDWNLVGVVYNRPLPYYVIDVMQDGTSLSEVSSEALVNSPGKWFYNNLTKTLYVRLTGDADPEDIYTVVVYRLFWADTPLNLPYDMDAGREVYYEPIILGSSRFAAKLDFEDQIGISLETQSTLSVQNNDGFFVEIYDKLFFENKRVKIFSYSPELPVSEAKTYFDGIIEDKSYSDAQVQFKIKDFLNVLREQISLPLYSESDGQIPDSVIGTPKRRVYGRVEGLRVQSLNQVLDGINLTGTFTASSSTSTVTGVGSNLLNELSPEDTVFIGEQDLKVKSVTSATQFEVSELIDVGISGETLSYKPLIQSIRAFANTSYLVAHHECREVTTTITQRINLNRITIGSFTDLIADDFLYIGGFLRQIRRISNSGIITLTQSLPVSVNIGALVVKPPIQKVYVDSEQIGLAEDFTYTNSGELKMQLDPLVEFRIAKPFVFTGTITFSNGSRNVSATGLNFKAELKTRDWIKPDSIAFPTWYEVLEIVDETNLRLRTAFVGAYSGTCQKKNIKPITDSSNIIVDNVGVTFNGLKSGEWVVSASDVVKHILAEAGLSARLNTQTFSDSDEQAYFLTSLALPLKPNDDSPLYRDVVDKINQSVFGSLHTNNEFEIEYNVLSPEKPAILPSQVIRDDDIISYSIRSTSKNIVRFVETRFRHQDLDRFTNEETYEVLTRDSDIVRNLVGTNRTNVMEVYLYNEDDARIMMERKGFINEISQSVISIRSKLKYGLNNINDKVMLDFQKLYHRFGSDSDGRKIGIISGITRSPTEVEFDVDDLGNIWNRVANITEDVANEYSAADNDEKIMNGYITDSNQLVDDDPITFRINLIG